MRKEPSLGWTCKHRHPLLVTHTETGRRAHCMGCGVEGPIRASLPEALWALRGTPGGALKPTVPPVDGGLSRAGVQ